MDKFSEQSAHILKAALALAAENYEFRPPCLPTCNVTPSLLWPFLRACGGESLREIRAIVDPLAAQAT